MPLETLPFDPARYLTSPEAQAEFLRDAFASGDAGFIADAIGTIARARGATQFAKDTGLSRETIYRAFRPGGNPTLETLSKAIGALGMKLSLEAA